MQATTSIAAPPPVAQPAVARPTDRSALPQYSLRQILAIWAAAALPIDPVGPMPRDLPKLIDTDRAEHFFAGNWGWFGMLVAAALLAPVVEELLFRGLLLPRMRGAFGKRDFVANGALFTVYHVHQPWSMPATLIDGIVNQAYPTRRFQSTWMGLITHTAPSFLTVGVVLALVL